jgi:hypothetical protein
LARRAPSFVAVLGLSAGVAVITAPQDFEATSGTGLGGTFLICGILWFVAWRRKAWGPRFGTGALGMALAGVMGVAAAGSTAVSEVVLAARGEPVEVVIVSRGEADADGDRIYELAPRAESTAVRGNLHTTRKLDEGATLTVLADPNEFVRPSLPEDVAAVPWVLIVLLGVGFLALSMIGFGFPLEAADDD